MTDAPLRPPYPPKQAKKPQRRIIRRPKAARNVAKPKHLARYMLVSYENHILDVDKTTE